MGLLQAAYRTYETQAHHAGIVTEGEREPLTPVSHIVMNAQIEVTLSHEGSFQSARAVPKEERKTIIPVTMASANRTTAPQAHPLCDQLCYVAPYGGDKFSMFLTQLEEWALSEYTHPIVRAVLAYCKGGTILQDLAAVGIINLNDCGAPGDGRVEGKEYDKCLVRWRVIPDHPSACWENTDLFECFIRFYADQCVNESREFCMITGVEDMACDKHPKGVVALNGNAKLISANDNVGFTYRGRFTQASQASSVSYMASQKAHNALRWVTANQGVIWGGRTFLCWNPEGKPVPSFAALGFSEEEPLDFVGYQNELNKALYGFENALKPEDDVVIAGLDAATTGRLSVTYYNELKGSDFLRRLERWYSTCCWFHYGRLQSPPVWGIVRCAFGTQRGDLLDIEDKVMREHVQQVLSCILDCRPIPKDLIRALGTRASLPLQYNAKNRESILETACALIRKSRNDANDIKEEMKEEWTLSLDTTNLDRSYLFGRLLAVMEHVERSTYDKGEGREPNAIRMQTVFSQRPLYGSRIIMERLEPYFAKLKPGSRFFYKKLIGEITDHLSMKDPELQKSLEDTYLLGYYHQRSELYRKKETSTETEE